MIPATGNKARLHGCDVATARDGRIVDHRLYFDQLAIPEQLGLAPAQRRRVAPGDTGHRFGGRPSYGVLSTTVVRVDTFAAARIFASSASRSPGAPTRTLRM